jgi:hypothetical protein
MKKIVANDSLNLVGEVVETYQHGGKRQVKILLKSVCVDLSLEDEEAPKLGDTVLIEAGAFLQEQRSERR